MSEIDLAKLEEAKDITCALARKCISDYKTTLMEPELKNREAAVDMIAEFINKLVNGDG
jgi:hypothetical protein